MSASAMQGSHNNTIQQATRHFVSVVNLYLALIPRYYHNYSVRD